MLRGVSQVPVIVATARDDEAEIVAVLDAGADDYVVKPFSAAQLDARIRAVLRRGGGGARRTPRSWSAGCGSTRAPGRPASTAARWSSRPREFDLLHYLAARAGQVVSKRELLTEVWQLPYGGADKTVDVHLSWLRRKLGETAQQARYLHSVRGVGVRIAAPAVRPATGCDRCAGGCCCSSRPRRRSCWSRSSCRSRCWCARSPPSARCSPRPRDAQALTALVAVADPAALALAVAQVDATSAAPGQCLHRRRRGARRRGAPHAAGGARRAGEQRVRARRRRPGDRVRGARPAGADRSDPHVRHRRGADRPASAGRGCCSPCSEWCCSR